MLSYTSSRRNSNRRITSVKLGFTLFELLTSITLTLIILVTVAQVFKLISDGVASQRSVTSLISRHRSICNSLQENLQQHTVITIPWPRVGSAQGYLEYVEGTANDAHPERASFIGSNQQYKKWIDQIDEEAEEGERNEPRIIGDVDDVLMMTCVTRQEPFRGRGPGGRIVESNLAEVIWYVAPDASVGAESNKKRLTLYRRILLIIPGLRISGGSKDSFFQTHDISAHEERDASNKPTGKMIPNTLADLTKPENRYAHRLQGNIGVFDRTLLKPLTSESGVERSDVLMRDCVGFDIRAWDPEAVVTGNNIHAIVPGDLGGDSASGGTLGKGAYVDLNYLGRKATYFSGRPHPKSRLSQISGIAGIFDTWTFDYETDNIDQDNDNSIDEGKNHLDDDGRNGVDDPGEQETSPPYVVPLRGLEIRVRSYQPNTRKVYEIRVVGDFMPE